MTWGSLFLVLAETLSVPLSAKAQLSSGRAKNVIIPAGTTFEGRMDATISSAHSHAGERFYVTLSSPLLANGTDVVIPAGAQVVGEVVEAIPASHVPYDKKNKTKAKPTGKLRVQLNGLRLPDGATYPLVATFIGEASGKGSQQRPNPSLGGGVAYVGNDASFGMVYPRGNKSGGGPALVTKRQMMSDPLYGDPERNQSMYNQPSLRELVKVGRELYIHSGSPMSVRLDGPLKMALSPVGAGASTEYSPPQQVRFQRAPLPPPPQASPDMSAQGGAQTAPDAQAAPANSPYPSFLNPIPGARVPALQAAPVAQPQATPLAQPATQNFMMQNGPQGNAAPAGLPANASNAGMSAQPAAAMPLDTMFAAPAVSPPQQVPPRPAVGTAPVVPAQAAPAQSLFGTTPAFSTVPAGGAPADAMAPAMAPAAGSLGAMAPAMAPAAGSPGAMTPAMAPAAGSPGAMTPAMAPAAGSPGAMTPAMAPTTSAPSLGTAVPASSPSFSVAPSGGASIDPVAAVLNAARAQNGEPPLSSPAAAAPAVATPGALDSSQPLVPPTSSAAGTLGAGTTQPVMQPIAGPGASAGALPAAPASAAVAPITSVPPQVMPATAVPAAGTAYPANQMSPKPRSASGDDF
jgi:hypothetical protein